VIYDHTVHDPMSHNQTKAKLYSEFCFLLFW